MKNIFNNLPVLFLAFIFVLLQMNVAAQPVLLSADGPGNTYEIITSKFAPGQGVNAVESAECATAHPYFGRHIAEVFDATLNKFVFSFYIHVAQDNDRCNGLTDRQRVEIKTYESSPANLKGTVGENITYKWKFKIPVGFKPSTSFTHIHQIKPVNGDDGNPLFTLTVRKGTGGNPNKVELITDNTNKVATPNLSEFEGEWVEATEFVNVGANGKYRMQLRRLRDNALLIDYLNTNIMTIRPDNDFIRPKWGIYRSLNTPADLRDDSLQFADFSIEENTVLAVNLVSFTGSKNGNTNTLLWKTSSEINSDRFDVQRSDDGINFYTLGAVQSRGAASVGQSYSFEDANPTAINYYRLMSYDKDGKFSTSSTILITNKKEAAIKIFPNPVGSKATVNLLFFANELLSSTIFSATGQLVLSYRGSAQTSALQLSEHIARLKTGFYILSVQSKNEKIESRIIKN